MLIDGDCHGCIPSLCTWRATVQWKMRDIEHDLCDSAEWYVCADGTTSSQLGDVRDTVLTLVRMSTLSGITPCRVVTHAAVMLLLHRKAVDG